MATYTGFAKQIKTKTGTGKTGRPWTLYSAWIMPADGGDGTWVSMGFDAPTFSEGDYVRLDTTMDKGREVYAKGSAKVGKAPERAKGVTSQSGGTAQGSGGSGYNDPARQAAIIYQSSRKDALEAVALLLQHDGLKLSSAGNKTAHAKNYAEITAAIDKLTVQYVNDVTTLRLMETVADAGAEKQEAARKPQGDLPEEDEPEAPSSSNDDDWED